MIKVKIIKTGEIKEVTNNEAHALIEEGIAKLYTQKKPEKGSPENKSSYKNRQMRTRRSKNK